MTRTSFTQRAKTGLKVALVVSATALTGACVTDGDALNARLHAMDDKINEALRNSASAKIDATTALSISTQK